MAATIQFVCLACMLLGLASAQDVAPSEVQATIPQGREDLLHWALEHSDPNLSDAISIQSRQKRVKELMEVAEQQPSETDLMKEAITILNHPDISDEQALQTLQALQILVEPIDNANDLLAVGGIAPVLKFLSSSNTNLQAAACYMLGTAASNNPTFQNHLIQQQPEIMTQLVSMIDANQDVDAVVKALYAAATMVRNQEYVRNTFYGVGGVEALVQLLTRRNVQAIKCAGSCPEAAILSQGRDIRKALSLLVDLVRLDRTMAERCLTQGVPDTMTRLLSHPDIDLQEKALDGVVLLLRVTPEAARNAFHETGTSGELTKMESRLKSQLMSSAAEDLDQGDFENHYFEYLMQLVSEAQKGLRTSTTTIPQKTITQEQHTAQLKDEL